MTAIRTLPDPPSTTDPINFSSKADAHVLALQGFTTDVNNFSAELESIGAISTTIDTITATATTTQLWNYSKIQNWTGAPIITDIPDAPQAGASRYVYPIAGTVITNNANLSVQGGENYTTKAGDMLTFVARDVSTFDVFVTPKAFIEFEPQSIGSILSYSTNIILNASACGSLIAWTGSAGVIELPLTPKSRRPITFTNIGSGTVEIIRSGSHSIYSTTSVAQTSVSVAVGESLTLVFDGGSNWYQTEVSKLPLGVRQTWKDLTGSRAIGSAAVNTSGRAISIYVSATMSSGSARLVANIDGITLEGTPSPSAGQLSTVSISCVPENATVTITASSGTASALSWRELRS